MTLPRLFVAVWPGEPATHDLATLPRKDQPGVRFVPEENWHVTLRFLGAAHPREVAAALDDVDVAVADVALGPVVEYLGDHSLIVRATGLDAMQSAVDRATRDLGEAPPRRRFVGHVTLARLGRAARRPGAFPPAVAGTAFASSFVARELALVQSHLDPAGARYETLATWPAR